MRSREFRFAWNAHISSAAAWTPAHRPQRASARSAGGASLSREGGASRSSPKLLLGMEKRGPWTTGGARRPRRICSPCTAFLASAGRSSGATAIVRVDRKIGRRSDVVGPCPRTLGDPSFRRAFEPRKTATVLGARPYLYGSRSPWFSRSRAMRSGRWWSYRQGEGPRHTIWLSEPSRPRAKRRRHTGGWGGIPPASCSVADSGGAPDRVVQLTPGRLLPVDDIARESSPGTT